MNEETHLDGVTKRMKQGIFGELERNALCFIMRRLPSFLDEERPSYSSKRLVKADGNN
jgi:hypothetical protein